MTSYSRSQCVPGDASNAMWMTGKEMTWVAACYFLGCFAMGYYWVRWRAGKDIRTLGSGNVGARNVGRLLGTPGFLVTLLVDGLKGYLAVAVSHSFHLDPLVVTMALLAVILGHNWPVQLGFQGGKGIAVSLGALLAYDPFIPLLLVCLFVPLWALLRLVTLSGLLAYALGPLAVFGFGMGAWETFTLSATAILVVLAHRKNIREEIARLSDHRSIKKTPGRLPLRKESHE